MSDDELRKRILGMCAIGRPVEETMVGDVLTWGPANIAVLFPSSHDPRDVGQYEIVYGSKPRIPTKDGDENPWVRTVGEHDQGRGYRS
jgi:hypothetical protein